MKKITLQFFKNVSFELRLKIRPLPSFTRNLLITLVAFLVSSNGLQEYKGFNGKNFKSWEWTVIKENQVVLPPEPGFPPDLSHWSARAGLQAIHLNGDFYIMGGRTPIPGPPGNSIIHGDVWKSSDYGKTWNAILPSNEFLPPGLPEHWSSRAYFQAVKKGRYMYIVGGQNFKLEAKENPLYPNCPPIPGCDGQPLPCEPFILESNSDFFNDVWRSMDGVTWTQMTDPATADQRWAGRAGLSVVVFKNDIYVMGGSFNDDPAVIGGPPTRVYFNDVWKSSDNGQSWDLVTAEAPWAKRAGGVAVVKNGYIYMIGGEEGFTCPVDPTLPPTQQPPCLDPPYFNDVWRTKDGVNWELVTADAGWAKRPGHQVVVAHNRFVLFGGFGLGPDNGITPANPSDMWVSNKGKTWKKINDAPWNATGSMDIKYDFDALVVKGKGKSGDAIFTFGGDRETFNFCDPDNFLNVDNDVWKFSFPKKDNEPDEYQPVTLYPNYPNPFSESTTLKFYLPRKTFVSLNIFDRNGRFIDKVVNSAKNEGVHEVVWDGRNYKNKEVRDGVYYAVMWTKGSLKTIKLFKN